MHTLKTTKLSTFDPATLWRVPPITLAKTVIMVMAAVVFPNTGPTAVAILAKDWTSNKNPIAMNKQVRSTDALASLFSRISRSLLRVLGNR